MHLRTLTAGGLQMSEGDTRTSGPWALRSALQREQAAVDVLDWDRFRIAVQRETARTVRNEHAFAVVLFTIDGANGAQLRQRHRLNEICRRVCRLGDCRGLLTSPHELGVALMLCDVESDAAWRIIQRVLMSWEQVLRHGRQNQPLHVQAWCYPLATSSSSPQERCRTEWSPMLSPRTPRPLHWASKGVPAWKRGFDLLFSTLLLAALSPLLVVLAAYIRWVSPGPAILKQARVGREGEVFACWKFRTMPVNVDTETHRRYMATLIHDDEESAAMQKKCDANRLIPGGAFLRSACLDELPQLVNVLRGEMSLIGPRPPIPYEVQEYDDWHMARFASLPGMTGLWQVSGKNHLTFREMVRLDIAYARALRPLLDLTILLRTPLTIFGQLREQRGAKREIS